MNAAQLFECAEQGEFAEKYGSNVCRVIEAFVAYGLPAPVFEATQGWVVVVTVFKVPSKPPELKPESQPESLAGLQMEAKVLRLLAAGPMSKKELSVAPGQKQVFGQLNKLVRVLQASGQIEATVSAKPNSRLQRYQLAVQAC